MLTVTYKASTGYWLVRNEVNETLFASQERERAEQFVWLEEVESTAQYQNWLEEQDSQFCEFDILETERV
jgi:hypothetical protein